MHGSGALRLSLFPLVAAATLSLVACHGADTVQFVKTLESASPVGSEDASRGQASAGLQDHPPTETGSGTGSPGGPTGHADHVSAEVSTTTDPNGATGDEGVNSDPADSQSGDSGDDQSMPDPPMADATVPGGTRVAERPRNNPAAADLLDHWGHRSVQSIVERLSLSTPASEAEAADLRALREAAQSPDEAALVPDLQNGDEVRILGAHRGVTYGRWTGGPADTLSIRFDLSGAGPAIRDYPAFTAILERAGKAWSNRIADTWTTWEQRAGDRKGYIINGSFPDTPVYVGAGGEVSTGLEIDVRDADLPGDTAGWANEGIRPPGDTWEPRFGAVEIDREYLERAGESALFGTLTHEIGHVLGAWKGGTTTEPYAPYTDTEAGTWTGPNVVALHGGPAPFQDASNTRAWVNGERDPTASEYDFTHSGVCTSLMAYCNHLASLPPFLPQAIDFAFLADLGMSVAEETSRPETYGLAGWTDYAGFTVAVSRDLRIDLADPQPHYDGAANVWRTLEVTDLLQVGVDAFGYRSTGDFSTSYPLEGEFGKVSYAGGLIGAAIDYAWMPPVIGNATLAVDLDTLDGTASFTSLAVYSDGDPETFAGGALYYPFALSDNAIVGTEADSTLSADFYGPQHEEVAGTLLDPRAGLIASFGATHDDRPDREEVIAAADYLAGMFTRHGATDSADNGWFRYRCETASTCEMRDDEAGMWNDWTAETRENVLVSTAGWNERDTARLVGDRDFMRIERQSDATTDDRQGRHVVDGYLGTLEHGAFGTGFEKYSDAWTDSINTPGGLYEIWTGVQGAVTGSLPDERAQWSGVMLGYQGGQDAGENPFVQGRATIDFYLSTNLVEVAFSGVTSRDGQRTVTDFGFDDIQPQANGTFAGGAAGILNGAFLGSGHEEAAGMFHHNAASVTGSFGARAVPDTVTLEETGAVEVAGTFTDDSGTHSFYGYNDWGLWGKQFHNELFGSMLKQTVRVEGNTRYYETPTAHVSGTPSGSNPVSGSAVWNGNVRAFDVGHGGFLPVTGNARLEVDFTDATVDVDFTDIDNGHDDLSWQGMRMTGGTFQDAQTSPTIEGAFYGSDHQGAAGKFDRDSLRGVFGAVRSGEQTSGGEQTAAEE